MLRTLESPQFGRKLKLPKSVCWIPSFSFFRVPRLASPWQQSCLRLNRTLRDEQAERTRSERFPPNLFSRRDCALPHSAPASSAPERSFGHLFFSNGPRTESLSSISKGSPSLESETKHLGQPGPRCCESSQCLVADGASRTQRSETQLRCSALDPTACLASLSNVYELRGSRGDPKEGYRGERQIVKRFAKTRILSLEKCTAFARLCPTHLPETFALLSRSKNSRGSSTRALGRIAAKIAIRYEPLPTLPSHGLPACIRAGEFTAEVSSTST